MNQLNDKHDQTAESLQPGGEFISARRIALLEAIDATGSISRAAKRIGLSHISHHPSTTTAQWHALLEPPRYERW